MERIKKEIVKVTDLTSGQSVRFYCAHSQLTGEYVTRYAPFIKRPYVVKYGYEIEEYIDTAVFSDERRQPCTAE